MSRKRTILIEATLVLAVLATGLTAAQGAHASVLSAAMQSAGAQSDVKIKSRIEVERTEIDDKGVEVTKSFEPKDVKIIPGDKLVFINAYTNTGAAPVSGFVITNPVHSAVEFTAVSEDWAELSVNGGTEFGDLADTNIAFESPDEPGVQDTRPATPADVTHIRWTFSDAIAPGATGEVKFRGVVK